jgi:hypothetical protein
MPTIPKVSESIPSADRKLLRAFPKVVQRLTREIDTMDKTEFDNFVKLLPGAIERFQESAVDKNDLDPTISLAIQSLVQGFSSRNAISAKPESSEDPRNTSSDAGESVISVSELNNQDGPENGRTGAVISSPRKSYGQTSSDKIQVESAENSEASERVEGRARVRGFRARTSTPQRTADDQNATDDSQGPNDCKQSTSVKAGQLEKLAAKRKQIYGDSR